MNLTVASLNALSAYLDDNKNEKILRLRNDKNGQYLTVEKKNFWTRLKMAIGFKSYRLENVANFVESIKNSVEGSSQSHYLMDVYSKLASKILHHNQNHPKRIIKISRAYDEAIGGIENYVLGCIDRKIGAELSDSAKVDEVKEAAKRAILSAHPRKEMVDSLKKLRKQLNPSDYRIIQNNHIAALFNSITDALDISKKIVFVCRNLLDLSEKQTRAVKALHFAIKKDDKDPKSQMEKQIDDLFKNSEGVYLDSEMLTFSQAEELKKIILPLFDQSSPLSTTHTSASSSSSQKLTKADKKTEAEVKQIARSGLVAFYKIGPTGFLGNFAPIPEGLKVFGHTFKCSEAAYQWRKFAIILEENSSSQDKTNLVTELTNAMKDPKNNFFTADGEEAFQMSKRLDDIASKRYKTSPVSWKKGTRDEVMWEVLNAKFSIPRFEQLLKATGNAYLLEHSNQGVKDDYWSDKHDGNGLNMLGRMLMAIREGKDKPAFNTRDSRMKQYVAKANSQSPKIS